MSLTHEKPPYSLKSRSTPCSEELHAVGGCSTYFIATIEQDYGGESLKSLVEEYKNDSEADFEPDSVPACDRILGSIYLGTLAVLATAEKALGYTHNDLHFGNVVVEFQTPHAVTTPSTEEHSIQSSASYQRETFADTHIRVRLIDQETATFDPSVVGKDPGTATELWSNVWLRVDMLTRCWKVFGKARPEEVWSRRCQQVKEFFEDPARSHARLARMSAEERRNSHVWCS